MTSLRFAVVGAGRLGASLALALRAAGLSVVAYTASTGAGRARAEGWLGGTPVADVKAVVLLDPDVYVIAVPDTVLPAVASRLGGLMGHRSGRFVAHTSGATTVAVLRPCADAGAATFVFHPLQTFTDPPSSWRRFERTAIAVTPSDTGQGSSGQALAFALAQHLHAVPFLLADDKRALYHAAATMACNYFVALEHVATGLFVRSGLPSEQALSLFLPLVRATLDNIETQGTMQALTGPLSRGDIGTVRGHLEALSVETPELLPIYTALGLATLDLVRSRGEIEESTIGQLARLLSPYAVNDILPTEAERITR